MIISNRGIGGIYPPLVIAEIGINHGGSLDVAKHMVRAAKESGCEIVKHQTHVVEDEMTPEAKTIVPPNSDRSIWDIMDSCALKLEEEEELKDFAESLGLIYISTPFSRAAANFLNDIGVPAFKIGSGECDNLPLIEHIVGFGKPVIMSTGMQTIESLRDSVALIENSGNEYCLLECTNLYPSPPEIVSLGGITELQDAFPNAVVGFSDHSIGPYMAVAAMGLGAKVIERHFTDSRYRVGPDIPCSMDPAELRLLVDLAKEIDVARNNVKRRTTPEDEVYLFARGSLVADRDLMAGREITKSDIWARRPGTGEIPARDFYKMLGKKLKYPVSRNTQFSWDMFESFDQHS